MPWLINASQLDKFRKSQKNVIILDASWHLPTENRDPRAEFLEQHVAGARFFDMELFHDKSSPVPNMLIRDEQEIAEKIGAMGITNEFKIIIYDNSKLHTSCRALWMFKVFGQHLNQLYVLDGGLDAWKKYGGKIEAGEPRPVTPKTYNVTYQAQYVRTLIQLKTNLHHPTEQVVDVRHPVRYAGGPETRPNMRPGHIPGSFSFPYMTMFENDGRWKSIDKIRRQLTGIGVDLEHPIIATCGSGMSASTLTFVLDLMEQSHNAIYDGSWAEWGCSDLYQGETSLDERPVVTSLD